MTPGFRTFAVVFLTLLAACGSGGSDSSDNGSGGTGSNPTQHVVIVVFENQDYSSIIGNSRMPFFNNLATQYALATQFYANTHPSIGNYFMMTTGQVVSNNDGFGGTFSGDNVARQLTAAGKTWKVYAESLPSAGYTGDDVDPYYKHHNPFAYFDDVINSASQSANIVPFSQFATDLNNNALPSFSLVVPNNLNSGHVVCSDAISICAPSERLPAMDAWLSANFAGVVQNTSFMNSSVLILTLDESLTDSTNGGGRIPVILAGTSIKTGFQSTTNYQFPSLLRFSLNTLGVTSAPGAAATAPSMREFVK